MADLDFSEKIPATANPEEVPTPYQRSVSAEVVQNPNYQDAFQKYAADSNWMSAIGSDVASKASSALASDLGSQAGQNPSGSMPVPITDFDKVYTDSYNTQAHATLGLQADKLITDANLEMAKAPRLTPDLIQQTNNKVSVGLNNIFSNAPKEIRPQLEYQYGAQRISQNASLTERMLREQREDIKSNTSYSSNINAENAHALAISGNYEAAKSLIESTQKANDAAVASHDLDPKLAKVNIDTVRQSYLIGKYSKEYENARAEGKGEGFLRNLADSKPQDISDADYQVVTNGLMTYVHNQNMLRSQDQTLTKEKFLTSILKDPNGITGSQITDLQSKLPPAEFQEVYNDYLKAKSKLDNKNRARDEALSSYTNINTFPSQPADSKNAAWKSVTDAIKNKPENAGITDDEAKIKAAAIAPTSIPAYIDELNAKLSTADPNNIESASQTIHYFSYHNLNQNLAGIKDESYAMVEKYAQFSQTMPPIEAAEKAHEVIYSKSKDQKEANKSALEEFYKSKQRNNEKPDQTVRRLIGTPNDAVIRNLPGYNMKATGIFNNFFNLTNGDAETATKLTKNYMESQYGYSTINGEKEYTFHPIEGIKGIPPNSIGQIQSDIVDQVNDQFKKSKEYFDNGKSDFWYEARQRINATEAMTSAKKVDELKKQVPWYSLAKLTNNFITSLTTSQLNDNGDVYSQIGHHQLILKTYNEGQPIVVIKHNRSGKDEEFEGAIQANPYGRATGNPAQPISGGWDFMIKTSAGLQSIALQNPIDSNITYNPRIDHIQNLYYATVNRVSGHQVIYNDEYYKNLAKSLGQF